MTIFSHLPSFRNATWYGCLALALIATGCASSSKIAQNGKGAVFLEEVVDWSFDASHPAVIDQMTMLKIVKGMHSADGQNGPSRMSAGGSKPMRVFSDEDAEFLAPLLAQGLSKAKPEQIVGFHVSSSAGSGSEPTAGSIYVQQGAIHFTITKGGASTTFLPESAARTEHAASYAAGGKAGATTQVIDYRALAKAPMPAALPVTKVSAPQPSSPAALPAASSAAAPTSVPKTEAVSTHSEGDGQIETQVQLSRARDMLTKKQSEIQMLRKESDWMKRELRDRDEEIKALKATVKTASKKKKAEAYRTR
jgi:hypothetical protein